MSDLYESITPQRRDAYLANAEIAFNEEAGNVIDQVINDMGELALQEAVAITTADAGDLETVAEGAERYLSNPDQLTDYDNDFMIAHEVASRRAREEIVVEVVGQTGVSFGDMFAKAKKDSSEMPPKITIEEEFAQKYQSDKQQN